VLCSAEAPEQTFNLPRDAQFHTAPAISSNRCLVASASPLSTAKCISDGVFPPPLDDHSADQDFVWDSMTGQIVGASSGQCITVGQPNYYAGYLNNNGTLEHEVWAGPLSSGKQVIILFNKGKTTEAVSAAWHLLHQPDGMPAAVHDMLAHKDLPALAVGSALTASVVSHGVQAFVVG
jgi:hypothetical protein